MATSTNGNTNDDNGATGYWARYEHLKYNDVMKNVLIEELISRYQGLQTKHDVYVKERSDDEETVKRYQAREKHLVASVNQLQHIMNREPFILVLIDGDGMIFNQTYLQDGETGGRRAATLLHTAAAQWAVASVPDCPTDVKVVVRVYANVKGLADICTKTGLVNSPAVIEDFVRGFTRGRALFDFVDVGYGKDRADGKLVEQFKLHLYDYHCRQIIFGCSHDNGYARLLEQYISDDEVISRVTMLEGVPFEKELAVLPFERQKFAGIFRESKINSTPADLLGSVRSDSRMRGDSNIFKPENHTPVYSPQAMIPQLDGMSIALRPAHLRSDSLTSSTNSSEFGAPKTWAGAVKNAAALPFTDLARPSSQASQLSSDPIKRNRKGQRLDEPMEYDRDTVQRIKQLKCCNQHYIGQGCCHYNAGKADKCPHRHDLKLSTKDLQSLRVVAKETPCKKGAECDEVKCIYGHSCPFPLATEGSMRGIGCLNGSACRFPESMHGMDKTPIRMTKVTGLF